MKGFVILFHTLLLAILAFASPLVWPADDVVYSFGIVPQFEQRKLFRIWRPILDELERRTGFVFKLVGSPKIPVFEQKFMEGAYDFAYMNPYHLLQAHGSQGYLPLVRDGSRMLKGILVVAKDSPIQSVQELAGKRVAFPSPNALGASLLLRAELVRSHGVEVIPHYAQTHSSVYLHVILGQTVAGGGVASTLSSQPPEIQQKLRILYETTSVSPHPVAVHPRVPETHREMVRQALLAMAQTKTGAALLARIPMSKAVSASLDDYRPMSSLKLEEFYIPREQSGE